MAILCFLTVYWNLLDLTNFSRVLSEVIVTLNPRAKMAWYAWLMYLFKVLNLTFSSSLSVSAKKRRSDWLNDGGPC